MADDRYVVPPGNGKEVQVPLGSNATQTATVSDDSCTGGAKGRGMESIPPVAVTGGSEVCM